METSADDIGRLFRERREHLGYSLQDAAQHTRIRKTYLESIENNRFYELPGSAYVTGFIRVYARYLGLDSNSLLAQIEESPGSANQAQEAVPIAKYQVRPAGRKSSGKRSWAFGAGFLIVVIIGGLIYLMPATIKDKADETVPRTLVEKVPTKTPEQAAVPVVEVEKPETPPVPEETAETGTAETETASAPAPAPAELPLLPPVPEGGASLRMLALAQSSLIINHDERGPRRYELHDGLDLTWKIKTKVTVEMADSGVARFWLDGQELELTDRKDFQLQKTSGE